MNLLIRIAGIAICTAAAAVVLKQHRQEAALLVSLLGGIVILASAAGTLGEAVGEVTEMTVLPGIGEYGGTMLRALGCAVTAQITADICRDAGEGALASKVELAGKAVLVIMAIPVAKEIVGFAVSLV